MQLNPETFYKIFLHQMSLDYPNFRNFQNAHTGAHTIGQGHCNSIINRIYPHVNTQYPKYYSEQLVANCTDNGAIKLPNYDNNTQLFNDPITPLQFDNQYFKNLKNNLGLFTSDESLFNDRRTIKLVEHYANNQDAFFKQFGLSLRKMGKIGVLTGTQGQIRKHCWVRNSHNADPALNPISLNFTDTTAN
jgi:peroxidase